MHTVTSYLPWASIVLALYAIDRWRNRPAARARWAALSLRDKIARQVQALHIGITIHAGLLVTFTGLYLAGVFNLGGLLGGTIMSGIYLAMALRQLRATLAARRAYDSLGPLAYLAEIQHAFGPGR